MLSAGTLPAFGQPSPEKGGADTSGVLIPERFHGAGCNIKYTYKKPLDLKAEECIANRAPGKNADKGDGDNFIRIKSDHVAGVDWVCKVRSIKGAGPDRMSFAGDCSNGGGSFPATVTLILRPNKVVSVDTFAEGNHINNDYRLQAGVQ